ncbi:uncharacterized protein V6R79_002761 [Siganus canaliculatus]
MNIMAEIETALVRICLFQNFCFTFLLSACYFYSATTLPHCSPSISPIPVICLLPFQGNCTSSMTSSTPVQLPCTELHVPSWKNKSHQERRGDIVASLRLLTEGVGIMKTSNQTECAASLLQRLEDNINNYLLILTQLQLNGSAVSPALSCVPRSTQSLSTVLLNYNQLISGKLEWFIVDLKHLCTSQ